MLLYVKILRYCIKLYNISNLSEFMELLTIKKIKYKFEIRNRDIIIYHSKNIKIDIVKSISDDKIVLSKKVIEKPDDYLCISSELELDIVNLVLYYVVSILSVATIFINYQVSFLLLVLNTKLKSNYIIILMMMYVILFLNLILYKNYFVFISILLLVLSYKYKYAALLSVIPLLICNSKYALILQYSYGYFLYSYCLSIRNYNLASENNFLKLLIKVPITNVESIEVDEETINKFGVYFFQVSSSTVIKINDINLKFVALESIKEQISIFYIRNENSFFTNRQKYSKIEYVNKYYIYLLERN